MKRVPIEKERDRLRPSHFEGAGAMEQPQAVEVEVTEVTVQGVRPGVVINDPLLYTQNPTVGARLLVLQFKQACEGITSDSWTLNILRKGYLPEFISQLN